MAKVRRQPTSGRVPWRFYGVVLSPPLTGFVLSPYFSISFITVSKLTQRTVSETRSCPLSNKRSGGLQVIDKHFDDAGERAIPFFFQCLALTFACTSLAPLFSFWLGIEIAHTQVRRRQSQNINPGQAHPCDSMRCDSMRCDAIRCDAIT